MWVQYWISSSSSLNLNLRSWIFATAKKKILFFLKGSTGIVFFSKLPIIIKKKLILNDYTRIDWLKTWQSRRKSFYLDEKMSMQQFFFDFSRSMGSVKVFLKKCVEIFRNMRCEDFVVYISAPNVSLCEKSIGYLKGSR